MARERWGSRLGVILAVAGSAIGLGNFLRFPVQAAKNGGGAFLIPYFVALLLVGLPLMWIEWTIGRFGGGFGHSTAPGMFHTLWNKNRFIKYFGIIGIFGPIVIFIYYTYIESWLLGYSWFALTGAYNACDTRESMKAFLKTYQGVGTNPYVSFSTPAYAFFLITFVTNVSIVYFGIQRGIEKVCKYGLPILFIFGIVLMARVLTLGAPDPAQPQNNALNGLGFLWNPDWSALGRAQVWMAAAGQICYTLSVGIGVILTYASYLSKKDDVALSGLTAAATNEMAEVVIGGSIVIPAAFAFFGLAGTRSVAEGGAFDLGFVTMPLVLDRMAFGNLMGFMWFGLLFLAGVTSSISLAQPAVAFLEDEFGLSKKRAVLVFSAVSFILCQPCILFLDKGVLDQMDFWGGTFCLVLFGTVETILFAWVFGMEDAWTELHVGSDITIPRFYRFIIKYITPVFLIALLVFWLWEQGPSAILLKDVPDANLPYVWASRALLLVLLAVLAFMVRHAWKKRRQNGEALA